MRHSFPPQCPEDGAGRALEDLGNPPQAGPPSRILRTASSCPGLSLRGGPRVLPCCRARSSPSQGRRLMDSISWSATQCGEHGQDLAEESLGAALVGLQVAGPLGLSLRQGPDLQPPVTKVADAPDGVRPAAADGHHHQGVAAGEAAVEPVPVLALVRPGGSGDADVPVTSPRWTPASRSRSFWLKGSIPDTPSLQVAAGPDLAENGHGCS